MWAVDTSWLFALFDEDDVHHSKARKEAEQPGRLLVNPIVLVEMLDLVKARAGRKTSLEVHDALVRMSQVQLVEAPRGSTFVRVMEAGHDSWHDASAIATALDEGAGLRTFDAAQKKTFAALA